MVVRRSQIKAKYIEIAQRLDIDDLSLEGWDVVNKRQRAIKYRMEYLDSLPSSLRAVANALPILEALPACIDAGCTTQEEAEEWWRSVIGKSFLDG